MHPCSSRSLLLAGLGALAASSASAQTVLITDNFEVDTSANYTIVDDGMPDGTQTFAFDYIAAGLPLAPRSSAGDLGGLRITANETAPGDTDVFTCFHNTAVMEGHYRMTVDVYMNFMGSSGSTEHGHVGVGGDGVTPNQYALPTTGSGSYLAFTGDGGSASDYRWFRDLVNLPAGEVDSGPLPGSHPSYLGHGANATGSTDPGGFYINLFPSPPSTSAGSPANIWTTLEIDVDNENGVISYSFDGQLVARGFFAGTINGLVSLGLADVFTSVSSSNNFTVYDNLVVETVPAEQTICTQSNDSMTVDAGGMVACGSAALVQTENQWLRRYVAGSCGLADGGVVTHINYGVQNASTAAGQQTIFVRAYSIPTGAPFLYSNMTLLSEEAQVIVDQAQTLLTATLSTPACVPAGSDLVLEIALTVPGEAFRPAGNNLGQSAPSYIAASPCMIDEPTDLAAIGFPDVALILDPVFGPLGLPICSTNAPNSTGNPATLYAVGSAVAADNDVTLHVNDLPNDSNGFFLTSEEVNVLPNPAGDGNICIASFSIGRYNGAIQNSGMTGKVSLGLDLTMTPFAGGMGTFGSVAVMAGETRYWQYWYRDLDPTGATTSNFSSAICITFQ